MKKVVSPGKGQFGGDTKSSQYRSTPVVGQMKCGTPHNLQSRKGTFSGKPSDIRSEKGKFSGGAGRQQTKAGGDHGAGHAGQPSGHSPGTFASTAHKGHTK